MEEGQRSCHVSGLGDKKSSVVQVNVVLKVLPLSNVLDRGDRANDTCEPVNNNNLPNKLYMNTLYSMYACG